MKKNQKEKIVFSEKTNYYPLIIIDENGRLIIKGRSMMDRPRDLYFPIIEKLEELVLFGIFKSAEVEVEYVNTTSKYLILKILKILDEIGDSIVIWKYEEGDETIKEMGRDFEEICDSIFVFKEVPE